MGARGTPGSKAGTGAHAGKESTTARRREIFEAIDTLAERVRKIAGTTIRSVGHVGRLQTIADDDDEFVRAPEMIGRLLADNRRMAEKQREAIELCDEKGDTPTGNILQDVLDQTEGRIWFLFELTQT